MDCMHHILDIDIQKIINGQVDRYRSGKSDGVRKEKRMVPTTEWVMISDRCTVLPNEYRHTVTYSLLESNGASYGMGNDFR